MIDPRLRAWLNPVIESDTCFVEPNNHSRAQRRASAAKNAVDFLRAQHDARPLLLSSPGSVNWRMGGLSDPVDMTASSDAVWTLDTDQGSALVTNEIEAPRFLYDYRVRELGWDILSVPWYEPDAMVHVASTYAEVAPSDLLRDVDGVGENCRDDVITSRLRLSEPEQEDLRDLGSLTGRALGRGIDAWRPGETTDFEIAGVISGYLEAHGAKAVCLIVGGDDRLRHFRHPLAIGAVISDALMAVVVARRGGLHAAATRICVRRADDEIITLVKQLELVNAAVLEASLPGGTWGDTLNALATAYNEVGQPGAWREHFQGGPIGFEQREFELAPTQTASPFWSLDRRPNTAVAWNPSLRGGAKIEDTYLVGSELELVSATPEWPQIEGPRGAHSSAVKVLP